MKNKTIISMLAFSLLCIALFFGASLTGLVISRVEYNDLCRLDDDCMSGQCCIIYQDRNLGLCMESCQSFDFLCTADGQCEEGAVCCIPEGKEYGICNYPSKCRNVDVFADYIGQVTFLEMPAAQQIPPHVEKPSPAYFDSTQAMKTAIILETAALIALIAIIIWILAQKKANKARKK